MNGRSDRRIADRVAETGKMGHTVNHRRTGQMANNPSDIRRMDEQTDGQTHGAEMGLPGNAHIWSVWPHVVDTTTCSDATAS